MTSVNVSKCSELCFARGSTLHVRHVCSTISENIYLRSNNPTYRIAHIRVQVLSKSVVLYSLQTRKKKINVNMWQNCRAYRLMARAMTQDGSIVTSGTLIRVHESLYPSTVTVDTAYGAASTQNTINEWWKQCPKGIWLEGPWNRFHFINHESQANKNFARALLHRYPTSKFWISVLLFDISV